MIITKINFQNKDLLSGNNCYKSNRKSKVGIALVSLALATAVVTGTNSVVNKPERDIIEPYVAPFSASVSASDINSMNIILNDCDCGNTFFTDVVEILKNDGLSVETTSDCADINRDNCTVITLDHQYSAGECTIVFAPYDNTRLGNSDSLAISMKCAFDQNGFLVSDILCSQVGYEELENGDVSANVPTATEDAIDNGKTTSFVTISFGTQNNNAEWVAKSIENGLARQKYYLDNYDNQTDLIYRANVNDSLDNVSDYFGTDRRSLKKYNNMLSDDFYDSQAIINSNIKNYPVFNRNSVLDIDGNKTKAY